MRKILKQFIVDNELTFTKGRRNSDCIIICGFALWLSEFKKFKESPKEEIRFILKTKFKKDPVLEDEFISTFEYADINDYSLWWENPLNREQYIID